MKTYPKSNLHTHTAFCDGKDTPREIVLAAIDGGMESVGFPGHSYTAFDESFAMSYEGDALYYEEIRALQREFDGKIKILLGLEQDAFSEPVTKEYDFLIHSVHYVHANGEYHSVDESRPLVEQLVREHFGGDYYRFASDYYRTLADLVKQNPNTVIGHFDLVTKFNEDGVLFDESDPRYLAPAMEALDALLEQDVIFEINTGAIARGYRRMPYPASIFLHRIAQKRGRVTFSSDAHAKENLMFGFDQALHLARAGGLGSITLYTKNGWQDFPL